MNEEFYACTPEQQGERLRGLAMEALERWEIDTLCLIFWAPRSKPSSASFAFTFLRASNRS